MQQRRINMIYELVNTHAHTHKLTKKPSDLTCLLGGPPPAEPPEGGGVGGGLGVGAGGVVFRILHVYVYVCVCGGRYGSI